MKPLIALFTAFGLLLFGFIGGSMIFSIGDSWINNTGYIMPNSSWNENVNITGNLTVQNSLVCTVDNGLCSSSGGNSSFNQTLTDVLYYPKNNNLYGYYNISTIPAYLTSYTETDPLWSNNASLYYLKSNPFGFYNISTLPASGGLTKWTNRTNSDQRVMGTTLANISSLAWTATANTNYTMECTIFFMSNNTANGLSLSLEDWGATIKQFRAGATITGGTTVYSGTFNTTGTKYTSAAVGVVNTIYPAYLNANIINNGNTITITPQFSAEVAGFNTTIVRDSYCNVNIG